ncbi:MAG: DUF1515 family protein [Sneathiella sp.]
MSDLDQISLEIGKLRADNDEAKSQRRDMSEKLEKLNTAINLLVPMAKEIENIKPQINDYKKMKNRGIGILIGVALAAGSSGAILTKFLQSFTASH